MIRLKPSISLFKLSSYCLILIGLCFAILLPAYAKTHYIRSEFTIKFESKQDQDIAEFLSKLLSQQVATQKAVQYLKNTGVLANIEEPIQQQAIAKLLVDNTLSYQSNQHKENQATHKVKLSYDSSSFPDDYTTYCV